jgi:hypothetical protein
VIESLSKHNIHLVLDIKKIKIYNSKVPNYQLKRRRNEVNKLITNLVKDIGQLGEKFASQATLA